MSSPSPSPGPPRGAAARGGGQRPPRRREETSRTPLRPRAPDYPGPPPTVSEQGPPLNGTAGAAPSLEDMITREEQLLARGRRGGEGRFKTELRRRVMHFTPSWFSCNMGTGVASMLLYRMPYQFHGLQTIGVVVFVLNVVLFVLFTAVTIARYAMWPSLFPAMVKHSAQSLFLGCFSMGLSTIVNMLAFAVAPTWKGGWVTFTWILWWINVVVALLIAIGVPYSMFIHHKHSLDSVTGAWLLPTVSTIVLASSGGIVAEILPASHARLTVIVSYCVWGTGFPIALLILSVYFTRLSIHKIPARAQIISTFIPLGPAGQGAFGILQLSSVVRRLGEAGGLGIVSKGISAEDGRVISLAVYGATMPVALVIWGFGAFWAVIAVSCVAHTIRHERSVPFNIGWWALTFPIGVWALSTNQLGHELDSTAFRVLGTVLSVIVVINWLAVFGLTVVQGGRGELFMAPCLSEMVPAVHDAVRPKNEREAAGLSVSPA